MNEDFTINKRIALVRKNEEDSQTEFGRKIDVSRNVIANIENNRLDPSPIVRARICEVFGVSRTWLETGEGEMYENLSEDLELADFVGTTLASSSEDFRKRLLTALSKLSPDEWDVLEKLANDLAATDAKKEDGDT